MLLPPGVPRLRRRGNCCAGLIRYDTALTGSRIAAQHVRRVFPEVRLVIGDAFIDAIVAMVGAGLGVSIVPQPRKALLEAHSVRALALGRGGPTRQMRWCGAAPMRATATSMRCSGRWLRAWTA